MGKFNPNSYAQCQLITEMFSKQIQPDTLEFTLNHLIDNKLDLSYFDNRFEYDATGVPTFDSIILFAYPRRITSSGKMACYDKKNQIFLMCGREI